MKFSSSVNFLFGELPFLERFQAAANAGFSGVEIQFLEASGSECAAAAAAADISVVLLNVDMGDLLSGGAGLSGVPGQEEAFLGAVTQAVSAANEMQARYIHLGPSRVPAGQSREACIDVFKRNLDTLLESGLMKDSKAKLLIEPMNRVDMPDALFTDVSEVAKLIRERYSLHVGLQFDIYHVSKNGGDVAALFANNVDVIDHVQFSDLPNRTEPGTGTLDFKEIFSALTACGYRGWFGAEYFPSKPTLETLGWLQKVGI